MMTDNEIIKALECCSGKYPCRKCPYYNTNCDYEKDVLKLINRQKKEIEHLKSVIRAMSEDGEENA